MQRRGQGMGGGLVTGAGEQQARGKGTGGRPGRGTPGGAGAAGGGRLLRPARRERSGRAAARGVDWGAHCSGLRRIEQIGFGILGCIGLMGYAGLVFRFYYKRDKNGISRSNTVFRKYGRKNALPFSIPLPFHSIPFSVPFPFIP